MQKKNHCFTPLVKLGSAKEAFFGCISQTLDYFFQTLQNSNMYICIFILNMNSFLHVCYTKFIKNISLSTNFEFSQKFPVKSHIFLHI